MIFPLEVIFGAFVAFFLIAISQQNLWIEKIALFYLASCNFSDPRQNKSASASHPETMWMYNISESISGSKLLPTLTVRKSMLGCFARTNIFDRYLFVLGMGDCSIKILTSMTLYIHFISL